MTSKSTEVAAALSAAWMYERVKPKISWTLSWSYAATIDRRPAGYRTFRTGYRMMV
jgi:hypothetical protein